MSANVHIQNTNWHHLVLEPKVLEDPASSISRKLCYTHILSQYGYYSIALLGLALVYLSNQHHCTLVLLFPVFARPCPTLGQSTSLFHVPWQSTLSTISTTTHPHWHSSWVYIKACSSSQSMDNSKLQQVMSPAWRSAFLCIIASVRLCITHRCFALVSLSSPFTWSPPRFLQSLSFVPFTMASEFSVAKTIRLTDLVPANYRLWPTQTEATFTVHGVLDIVLGSACDPMMCSKLLKLSSGTDSMLWHIKPYSHVSLLLI